MGSQIIFQPNNHSQWRIGYKPVASKIDSRVRKILREQYNFDQIKSIEQVAEAEVNSNNFKVTLSDGRCFLLRRYIANLDANVIDRTIDIMEHLAGLGVQVPQVIKTVSERRISIVDGEPHTLFAFIEGDHYRGTGEELASAGKEIGRLDQALVNLPASRDWAAELSLPAKAKEFRIYSQVIWQEIFMKASERVASDPTDRFHADLLGQKDFIFQAVEKTLAAKPIQPSFGVVHFDLHPHNLLANGEAVTAILDFDSLRYLERSRALAFALHRMVRQYIIYNQRTDYSAVAAEARKIFLDTYRQANSINDEALAAIPYFIRDEALCRLTYAMKDQYFNSNPAWRQDLPKQTAAIAEAVFFE